MSHPLRENLEVVSENGADSVRCSKCQHRYCGADEDWRAFATVRLSAPSQAGRLFGDLEGSYLLRQLFCPSCAALVETDFIESPEANRDTGN
jgi:acetone carboxylase gamma subunit